jgi:hypothetical protein
MTYNEGDVVVVVDPKPFLDNRNYTDGLYFNDTRMSVFIGRKFIISRRRNKNTYRLRYIDEHDCLETKSCRIEEWIWNENWLMPASEFDFNELECCELFDVMYMVEG